MYKLIFADDEALVRNNITKLVQWEKYGFEMVGCCANGHELLEMVEKDPPDLVITDIDMPFISGIDAARQMKNDFPTVKIIFLTGYDDFNYAQQAIDLKVAKYILKPVTAQNMLTCLKEMKEILDKERLQNRNMTLLENFYYQNKSMLQNAFLNSLLTTEVNNAEAAKKVELLRLDYLASKQFQVAVIMEDGNYSGDWSDESASLMNFAVYSITKEILEDRKIGSAILGDGRVVALLTNAKNASERYWKDKVVTVLEEIRAYIEKYLDFTVSIGVGNICHSYNSIHRSYNEAISALGYRYAIGTNRVIFINDIEPQRHNTPVFNKEKELQLLACIKANNRDEIIQMIDTLIKDVACRTNIDQLRSYVISIIICIVREAESIGLDTQELLRLGDIRKILDLKTVKQLKDTVLNVCFSLMENISQNRRNNCSASIEEAKCYIHEHYADFNISVDAVSQHLHLSSSYFRALFKKETGTTFVNYLTELRMQKAKALICSTSMKIYEIAEAVGYSDPQYFSYCFKKRFKMAPNELRESLVRC
ncbi:MAG TPA: response regulator [Clostridiaceae bacterium]|nr:response regulator [Clostridiaceae bacterium]